MTEELKTLIARIALAAQSLHDKTLWGEPHYDIKIDKELGEIEALVHEARGLIDDEWRKNRERSEINLEELGL